MDVLLIGSDNPLGTAVLAEMSRWGRHQATLLTAAASRWRSERQAKKAARKGKPAAIVDLRLAWQVAAGDVPQPLDIDRSYWLAKACEHSAIHYLLLSSDQVFSGHTSRSLREGDGLDAYSEPGFQLVEAEGRVNAAAPSSVVLRTGPLFAPDGGNLFTHTVRQFTAVRSQDLSGDLDDRSIFCPVACEDAARVIVAMLDQLSVGADAAGVFHYCSGDRATEFGFAEAVLAASGQYRDYGAVVLHALEHDADTVVESRVLDCSRLRDSFAIKQVPWRGFIDPAVKQIHQNAENLRDTEK
ncbi:MAG: sugar nucleotide-binding protein [Congregibacter sp.]